MELQNRNTLKSYNWVYWFLNKLVLFKHQVVNTFLLRLFLTLAEPPWHSKEQSRSSSSWLVAQRISCNAEGGEAEMNKIQVPPYTIKVDQVINIGRPMNHILCHQ